MPPKPQPPKPKRDFAPPRLPLDVTRLRKLASERLSLEPSQRSHDRAAELGYGRSDFDLNPGLMADLGLSGPFKPASVLIGIVKRPALTLLLTQRSSQMTTHAGQIAFPGGKIDDTDKGPLEAALREAHEEIGLEPSAIEPLGFIDKYKTGTGFLIHCLVALIEPDALLALDLAPGEVEEAFEVPLDFVLDPANHERGTREFKGRPRAFFAIPVEQRYIWGATAAIIRNLSERLGS